MLCSFPKSSFNLTLTGKQLLDDIKILKKVKATLKNIHDFYILMNGLTKKVYVIISQFAVIMSLSDSIIFTLSSQ